MVFVILNLITIHNKTKSLHFPLVFSSKDEKLLVKTLYFSCSELTLRTEEFLWISFGLCNNVSNSNICLIKTQLILGKMLYQIILKQWKNEFSSRVTKSKNYGLMSISSWQFMGWYTFVFLHDHRGLHVFLCCWWIFLEIRQNLFKVKWLILVRCH